MRSCDDWGDFYARLERALPKFKRMPLFDKADGLEWSTEITPEEEGEGEPDGTESLALPAPVAKVTELA
jgi:hypothetical protein